MKLFFAGTRGEIEEENPKHKYHSSLALTENSTSLLIDFGTVYNENLLNKINNYEAVLITHAHPDHYIWTARSEDSIRIPVYLTKITLDYSIYKPVNTVMVIPGKKFNIGNFEITAFDVIHSLRCPAVCYKIKYGTGYIVYAPDILDTAISKDIVFADVDMLIADGSSFNINMARRRGDKLYGHAMIKTIINWCRKYKIEKLIITHCGKQIVAGDEEEIKKKILDFADGQLDILIAYDNLDLKL